MDSAIFDASPCGHALLLPRVRRLKHGEELAREPWEVLALNRSGCDSAESAVCRILLVPGDCAARVVERIKAETVITYGLSQRDSLTFSSLSEPVLCVQRELPRPDGEWVLSQEFPLPPLPGDPESLLPVLGMNLLLSPQMTPIFTNDAAES